MSRYTIEREGREIAVGWDPPLGTFFAQIFAPQMPEDEEDCIWWVGYGQGEVTTVAALTEALREQGITLPDELATALRVDQLKPWEPGPLQKKLGFTGAKRRQP